MVQQGFILRHADKGDEGHGMGAFGLHGRVGVLPRIRVMVFTRVLIAPEVRRVAVIAEVDIDTAVNELRALREVHERAVGQFAVAVARCEDLHRVQGLEIALGDGETGIPAVMIIGNDALRLVSVSVLAGKTDVVLQRIGAVSGGEAVVDHIAVSGVIIEPHGAAVVILVKPACVIIHRQTVMHDHFVIGVLTTHLESVTVALAGILGERDGDGVSVAVDELRADDGFEPVLIGLYARVGGHVIISRSVAETDGVLDHGIGRADPLEEIPSVIGVIPRAASYIMIAVAGELLVGKAVCVTPEISGGAGHRFIIEVIMAVHIADDVVSAAFHLASCVRRTVYIEVLEQVKTAFIIEVVLARIA